MVESVRIAVDPFREREYPLATGLIAEAGVRAARAFVPTVFRLVSELRQARSRPLGDTLSSVVGRLKAKTPEASSFNPDLDPVLSRHARAFRTHPLATPIAELLNSGQMEKARDYLRQNWSRLPTFLMPVVDDLLGEVGARSLRGEGGIDILQDWKECQANASLKDQFPIERFGKSNLRGIVDYDRDAFGNDSLGIVSAGLKPNETLLWKMINRLPRGAHLADWGSGAGIFGHQVKAIRPDLRVTSVDLFPPEEILDRHAARPVTTETLRSEMSFLTGNAVDVSLDPNNRADFLNSVFLLPWVPDPLRFFAHMYNQLKPGGVMLATVHMETYDVDRPFGERMIGQALADDLKSQGVQAELSPNGRTIAVRRPDERTLSVAASLESSSYEELQHVFGFLSLYYNFYRRSPSGPLWIRLK
jgi:SAM-dependent methyltransferase